jgi:hypothetical protein
MWAKYYVIPSFKPWNAPEGAAARGYSSPSADNREYKTLQSLATVMLARASDELMNSLLS